MKFDTNLDIDWFLTDPGELSLGQSNEGLGIAFDGSSIYFCINGVSAIDNMKKSYYVFRVNQNGAGQLKGIEVH